MDQDTDCDGEPPPRLSRRRLFAAGAATGAALSLSRTAGAWPVTGDEAEDTVETVQQPNTPRATQPSFSDVARVEPDEVLRFLAGRHARYPGVNLDSLMGFSPADILETMDTVVLDTVHAARGGAALDRLYDLMAVETLEALLAVYGGEPVVLALDAGHGGRRGVYYDPGSNGTEAAHAREVVAALEARAADARYDGITIRRIFNDAIGDDFGLPPPEDRKSAAALTLRNARAAMLVHEAAAWNAAHPQAPVTVHVLSVHFNAGSGGTLVLHQGSTVPAAFLNRSIDYARAYVDSVRPLLNSTGLLPYPLRLALGTGLSDDHVLYEPQVRVARINPYTGADRTSFPRRYAMLQTSLLQRDYALGALIYHGLVDMRD